VKAPGRSYRRASLRASLTARGFAARFRGASRLAPFAAVLTSPGRRRATGPFQSRPCQLVRQSERAGL